MVVPYDRRVGLYRRVGTSDIDVEPAELCPTCLGCLQETAEEEEMPYYLGNVQFRHHRSLDALGQAIQRGCSLCLMLWKRLEQSCPLDLASIVGHTEDQQIVEYRVERGRVVNDDDRMVWMSFPEKVVTLLTTGKIERKISVYPEFVAHDCFRGKHNTLTGVEGVEKEWSTPREAASSVPTASNTGDDSVLELASRWLTECSTDHEDCQNGGLESTWLPLRLVEIKSSPDSGYSFRCVDSSAEEVSAQTYLTLSYRWGSQDCLQLQTSTAHALNGWTEAQALPKTLREAFVVCSYLKIPHIWIDRLCIIQDDPQDWIIQAAQMGKIYANAFCNLAADASEHDDGGLFRERDPHELAAFHYYQEKRLGRLRNSILIDVELWDSRVTEAPLNQRAWVLQERLLSRRTLHFSKDQLLWECRKKTATERFPWGLQVGGRTKGSALFQYPHYWAPEWRNKTCVNRCSICTHWYGDIVTPLTSAGITYADDRPLAFAGIGQVVSETIQDVSVAGMLLGHFRKQLLWSAVQFGKDQITSGSARHRSRRSFPSFSWLSVDCGIQHIGYNFRPENPYLFDIHHVDVAPITLVDGQLRQAGRLQLNGFLLPVHLQAAIDRHGNNSWNLEKPSTNFCADFTASQDEFVKENEGSPFPPFMYPDWTRKDLPVRSQGTEHYLMLAAVEFSTVYFLILEEVDLGQGVFRRIGICGLSVNVDRRLLEALGIHGASENRIGEHALAKSLITIV